MKDSMIIERAGDVTFVHAPTSGQAVTVVDTLAHSADKGIHFFRRVIDNQNGGDEALVAAIHAVQGRSIPFSEGLRSLGLEDPDRLARLREATGVVIDPKVIGFLSGTSVYGRDVYEFYSENSERGERRRETGGMYPFFAAEIAGRFSLKFAIDRGKPPIVAFGAAFGARPDGQPIFTKGFLKRFLNRTLPDNGVPVQTVIDSLGQIQVDWFPKDDDEWEWFLTVVEGVERTLCRETGLSFADLVAASKGKWREFVARAVKAADNLSPPLGPDGEIDRSWKPSPEDIRQSFLEACSDAVGMVRRCRNQLLLPSAAFAAIDRNPLVSIDKVTEANLIAADMLFAGKSLVAIFETHRSYVYQAAHIDTSITGEEIQENKVTIAVAEDGWPPLCEYIVAPNGLHLVPLTDPRQLKDEGRGWGNGGYDSEGDINEDGTRGLNLCVGHYYVDGARRGEDHMISVREVQPDGSFKRKALARYHIRGDFEGIKQIEYKGYRNSSVSANSAEGEAIAWFEDAVERGEIPLNRNGVLEYTVGRRKIAETVEAYCDYEWSEDGPVERAVAGWKPYLKTPLDAMAFDEFLASEPVQSLAEVIAPAYGRYSLAI